VQVNASYTIDSCDVLGACTTPLRKLEDALWLELRPEDCKHVQAHPKI